MRQHDGGVVTPTTYLCSWFESRYPSSEIRRILHQESPSFEGLATGLTGWETRNETKTSLRACAGLSGPGPDGRTPVTTDGHGQLGAPVRFGHRHTDSRPPGPMVVSARTITMDRRRWWRRVMSTYSAAWSRPSSSAGSCRHEAAVRHPRLPLRGSPHRSRGRTRLGRADVVDLLDFVPLPKVPGRSSSGSPSSKDTNAASFRSVPHSGCSASLSGVSLKSPRTTTWSTPAARSSR